MDKFLVKKSSETSVPSPTSSSTNRQLREDEASCSSSLSSTNRYLSEDQATCSTPISDLSSINENPTQYTNIKLLYPKNKDQRNFQPQWFSKFRWLEYSKEKDSAFCHACRHFGDKKKDNIFRSTGFSNWRKALEKGKGFLKHESTTYHILAMSLWDERNTRKNTHTSVLNLVSENVCEQNRYYLRSIIEIIQFIVLNELSLRGSYYIEDHVESGLFKNLFEFTLKKDTKLAECAKIIPKNATYLSPDIQNEIIDLLAKEVTESVVVDLKNADVPWFTILEDGTKDKNNRENVAIGLRFVKDGKAKESTLIIKTTKELDAKSFTNLTLKTLREEGIDCSKMLSQCYDGASVMSGEKGGVQALIQKELGRKIPYVHCANHRLHLVVVKAIAEIREISHFFDQSSLLYNFLKRGTISKIYEGQPLVRLLEQRWSGHLQVTQLVANNFEEILKTLETVKNTKSYGGDYISESIGLLSVMSNKKFQFSMIFMKKVLEILQPADKLLQARESSLNDSLVIIRSIIARLQDLRNDDSFLKIIQEVNEHYFVLVQENQPPARRRKIANTLLRDYLITDKIGERSEEVDGNQETYLKSLYNETIDLILSELNRRFTENNELIMAISAVDDLNLEKFDFLKSLGICLPSIEELAVVKKYLSQMQDKTDQTIDMFDEVFRQKIAFADTYSLLATARVFGCSTALCESTFSVLTRINRPQRTSMLHQMMENFILLSFEKERTKKINIDKILQKFNNLRNRRLQIF